jgi:hypothetical protein
MCAIGQRAVLGGPRRTEAMRTKASICARKQRFSSSQAAVEAIARSGLVLRPYRCDRCQQYHLTSRTKGKWVTKG